MAEGIEMVDRCGVGHGAILGDDDVIGGVEWRPRIYRDERRMMAPLSPVLANLDRDDLNGG